MNGIILYRLIQEIKSELVGNYIDEVRVSGRFFQIIHGKAGLYISLYPEALALFRAKSSKRGFDKRHAFSNELASCKIVAIEQSEFLPVATITMERHEAGQTSTYSLELSFYRQAPNMSLVSARSRRSLYSRSVEKQPKQSLLDMDDHELEKLLALDAKNREAHIVHILDGVDKFLAHDLTMDRVRIIREVLSGKQHTYCLVSVMPLQISIFSSTGIKSSVSLNSLFEHAMTLFLREKTAMQHELNVKILMRNLKKRIKRLQSKLLSDEEIESLRSAGELILSNIARIQKGSKQVNLQDPYTGKTRAVELDVRKTPQENAQSYFTKYKKLKRGQPMLKKKIRELELKLQHVDSESVTHKDVSPEEAETKQKKQPFRVFHLSSGATVYVGKSARSNDELTFSFARPVDYFFHVRGYEGAHVILRAQIPKGQRPRREDLQNAGAIAAYFSKARTQRNVAVSYTQRKYLKKAKRGKAGTVTLMREEVVFVDPGIPDKIM